MKKILALAFCLIVLYSCKKEDMTTQSVGGILYYDNFPDGWGLYYVTDSSEPLILKSKYLDDSLVYHKYKQYVNLHTSLKFNYDGEKGCLYGFGPSCGLRVVNVVSFTKN